MDPLNDERTNVMIERVSSFHENCLHVKLKSEKVFRKETKTSKAYVALAEDLRKMARMEANKELRTMLNGLGDVLSEIETHRDGLVVSRLQNGLISKMKELDETCNHPTSVLLKDRNYSVRSSMKLKEQFDSIASKSHNQKKMDKKKLQLEEEKKRVYNIDRGLQKNLLRYEEKRLNDCKDMFEEFIKGQLLFHCRAVEALSSALKQVNKMDSSAGVEQLCDDLHISAKRLDFQTSESKHSDLPPRRPQVDEERPV